MVLGRNLRRSLRALHSFVLRKAYESWLQGEEPNAKHQWVKGLTKEDAAWMQRLPFTLSIPAYRSIVVTFGNDF